MEVKFHILEYTNLEYCTQWDLIDESVGCSLGLLEHSKDPTGYFWAYG